MAQGHGTVGIQSLHLPKKVKVSPHIPVDWARSWGVVTSCCRRQNPEFTLICAPEKGYSVLEKYQARMQSSTQGHSESGCGTHFISQDIWSLLIKDVTDVLLGKHGSRSQQWHVVLQIMIEPNLLGKFLLLFPCLFPLTGFLLLPQFTPTMHIHPECRYIQFSRL